MVVMLKKQIQRVLYWGAVFTFNGMVILSARGAYAGLSQAGRREQQCASLELSNRYAALEPDAELPTDDEEEELVSASEEEEEELVPVSDCNQCQIQPLLTECPHSPRLPSPAHHM
jgi:hypothetical protein